VNDVLAGKSASVSGVQVKGSHLVITLMHAAPDFLARVAMPFFSAVPANIGDDPNGALTPASAGPYYVAARTPNKTILLKANPNYHGPRPHNVAAINYTIGNSQEAIRLRVEQGASDYAADGVPSPAYADLASKYGINKGQFHVEPTLTVRYVAMNTSRPLFSGNVALRKAVNFALDRHALQEFLRFHCDEERRRGHHDGVAGRDPRLDVVLAPVAAREPGSRGDWLVDGRWRHVLDVELRREGEDPAETLLEFTRRNGVTQIFLSKPSKAAAPSLGRRNFVMDVVRLAKDRQVTVVADRRMTSPGARVQVSSS